MVLIAETIINFDKNGNTHDHQSRVIEVESWNQYTHEIIHGMHVEHRNYLGNIIGCSIPLDCRVENIGGNHEKLSCDVYNSLNKKRKLLASLL